MINLDFWHKNAFGEKLIIIGLILCLLFYGFAYESTYLGLSIMLVGWIIICKDNGFLKAIDTPLTKMLVALIFVALISLLNVEDFREAGNKLGNIIEFLIAFFATHYVFKNKSERFHKIFAVFSLLGVFWVSAYGIYQYHFLGVNRIVSSLSNSNILGVYIILILPLGLSLLDIKNLKYKILIIFSILILNISLIYTLSRSAFLGALVAMVIFAILKLKNKKKVVISILLFIILISFIMPQTLVNRFEGTYQSFSERESPRIYIWKNAYEMFEDNPILGAGIGQYGVHYKVYEDGPASQRDRHSHAHNIFLHVGSELGLLGLVVLVWIMLKMLFLFHQFLLTEDGFNKTLAIALTSSFGGFFVQEQFEFSLINAGGIIILTGVLLGWYIALLSSVKILEKEVDNN